MAFETVRSRRHIVAAGAALATVGVAPGARADPSAPAPAAAAAPIATLLVEQTFLKAKPGKRADLIRFIEANWFAMDQQGLEAGIFTFYTLYADIDDNPDWDLVMAVGYPQREGYEQPATKARFDSIRKAHKVVPINGNGLAELGAIVRHHRLAIAGNPAPTSLR